MNKTLLERHPLAATFVLIVVSGVVAAVITANLSGIGGAIGLGLRLALPWIAAISGAVGVLAACYVGARIVQSWPKRLASGVLQVGPTLETGPPTAASRAAAQTTVAAGGSRHRRTRRHGRAGASQGRDQSPDSAAASRTPPARARPAGDADEPTNGLHRPAGRRQDGRRTRPRQHLRLDWHAAEGPRRRGRPRGAGGRLHRPDCYQDAGGLQGRAERHSVHR